MDTVVKWWVGVSVVGVILEDERYIAHGSIEKRQLILGINGRYLAFFTLVQVITIIAVV